MTPSFPPPGSAPATLVHHPHRTKRPPVLRLMKFGVDRFVEERPASVADLPDNPAEGEVWWLEMDGLGDLDALRALGSKFDLHPLTLEDTLNTGQRPKFEPYEKHAFIVAQMIYPEKEAFCAEQVSIFICKNVLITIQEEPEFDVFEPVRERLRSGRGFIRRMNSDYVAYALLDSIIDFIFPVLEALGAQIEDLEDELVERPSRNCALRVHEIKRSLMQLRRAVWPLRDVVNSLLHDESGLITPPTKIYLRDCYDHTVQIMDLVESYRDVSSGLMELYLSAVGMRTNEIMRVLTVISAIFIPLTFVVGLYGMNFDWDGGKNPLNMPELHWRHGYLGCVAVMIAIAIGQIVLFRKKGWI